MKTLSSQVKSSGIDLVEQIQLLDQDSPLPRIRLSFGKASLCLSLQGAHIRSYKPDGVNEILWMSESANFAQGKAIRGGIPICWPWFGPHWQSPDQPQHGYARVSMFELISAEADETSTRVTLELVNTYLPQSGLVMRVEVALSDVLEVQVHTLNRGEQVEEVGGALHTYFRVPEIDDVRIPELTGLDYLDKIRNGDTFRQNQPLSINAEVDRVYQNAPDTVRLLGLDNEGAVEIQTWGSSDLVVWNPWVEKATAMADFDNQGYREMLCIEPANAQCRVRLNPGEQHILGKKIALL